MDAQSSMERILGASSIQSLDQSALLNLILPPKDTTHTLDQIDEVLNAFLDEVEKLQRSSNDEFDKVLDEPVRERLKCLSDNLVKTQDDILELNANISRARQQFELAQEACNDKVIHERQEMVQTEKSLRRSLQQSKFNCVKSFFDQFVIHLEGSIVACRKLLAQSSVANYLQALDWSQYHQVMFLLRACGQAMIDLQRCERLYQSHKDFFGLSFRQPLDKIDLNNFIEFHVTYSLETQLDVVVNSQGDRVEFGRFVKEPHIEQLLMTTDKLNYELFGKTVEKMGTITVDCCRILVDLNLNYIEAHLTAGLNKLNGLDTANTQSVASNLREVLPSYAFSPQDYITQIGQHLMALRKQTEKFDHIDNLPLLWALDHLKFVNAHPFEMETCTTVTETILQYISRQIIRSLVGRTAPSVLSQLTVNGRKQLSLDASYLHSVLEDLNLMDFNDPSVEKFKSLIAQ